MQGAVNESQCSSRFENHRQWRTLMTINEHTRRCHIRRMIEVDQPLHNFHMVAQEIGVATHRTMAHTAPAITLLGGCCRFAIVLRSGRLMVLAAGTSGGRNHRCAVGSCSAQTVVGADNQGADQTERLQQLHEHKGDDSPAKEAPQGAFSDDCHLWMAFFGSSVGNLRFRIVKKLGTQHHPPED